MELIKIIHLSSDFTEPDEDGDVLEIKVGEFYEASKKGGFYRIYEPNDVLIPVSWVEVVG
jgi:hypothetical protein